MNVRKHTFYYTTERNPSTVYVTGNFNNWKCMCPLVKVEENRYETTIVLPYHQKVVEYKFIVDDRWVLTDDQPTTFDSSGSFLNHIAYLPPDPPTIEHTFSWIPSWGNYPRQVIVTGSFDDWKKSIQMKREADNIFRAKVLIPITERLVQYKFVVDGVWLYRPDELTVSVENGFINNIFEIDEDTMNPDTSMTQEIGENFKDETIDAVVTSELTNPNVEYEVENVTGIEYENSNLSEDDIVTQRDLIPISEPDIVSNEEIVESNSQIISNSTEPIEISCLPKEVLPDIDDDHGNASGIQKQEKQIDLQENSDSTTEDIRYLCENDLNGDDNYLEEDSNSVESNPRSQNQQGSVEFCLDPPTEKVALDTEPVQGEEIAEEVSSDNQTEELSRELEADLQSQPEVNQETDSLDRKEEPSENPVEGIQDQKEVNAETDSHEQQIEPSDNSEVNVQSEEQASDPNPDANQKPPEETRCASSEHSPVIAEEPPQDQPISKTPESPDATNEDTEQFFLEKPAECSESSPDRSEKIVEDDIQPVSSLQSTDSADDPSSPSPIKDTSIPDEPLTPTPNVREFDKSVDTAMDETDIYSETYTLHSSSQTPSKRPSHVALDKVLTSTPSPSSPRKDSKSGLVNDIAGVSEDNLDKPSKVQSDTASERNSQCSETPTQKEKRRRKKSIMYRVFGRLLGH